MLQVITLKKIQTSILKQKPQSGSTTGLIPMKHSYSSIPVLVSADFNGVQHKVEVCGARLSSYFNDTADFMATELTQPDSDQILLGFHYKNPRYHIDERAS